MLKKVGFKDVETTPVNIYTKEIIEEIATEKNLGNVYSKIDTKVVDGAFAEGHIKAHKFYKKI